jgi:broad specificity phosphatase PhoE
MADLTEQGTPLVGYEERGPYSCGDCTHRPNSKSDICIHPLVVAAPEMAGRLVQIGDQKGVRINLERGCCSYVQASKKPIVLLSRHGETALNKEDAFRSWINVPLNEDGVQQAQDAADFLKDYPIKAVYCSPLDRAVYTAMLAAEPHGLTPTKDESLLPWNLGELSGKSKKKYMTTLKHYIENAEDKIPGGESLQDFKDRMFKAFDVLSEAANPDNLILVVAHTSTITALHQWIDEEYSGSPETDETVGPGGIVQLVADPDKDEFEAQPILGEVKPAEFGS